MMLPGSNLIPLFFLSDTSSPSLTSIRICSATSSTIRLRTESLSHATHLLLRMDRKLFEAACTGNVGALLQLLRENPLILSDIALTSPEETPLHIAAKAGHLDFVQQIVKHKPGFAIELNKDGFRPMDIASANGHVEIVRALLTVNHDLCLLKGRNKRTPLHYAAVKGRVEIINELLSACPYSVNDVTAQRQTALHLAAKNNQFEAFRVLVQWLEQLKMEELINWRDHQGNTVLHLVTARKQIENIELLFNRCNNVRGVMEMNATNAKGLTAMDVLDVLIETPSDIELKELLRQAGALGAQDVNPIIPASSLQKIRRKDSTEQKILPESSKDWFKYFQFHMDRDSPSDTRNAIIVVAALVATVTFQAGISPPDGILHMKQAERQSDNRNTTGNVPKLGPGVGAGLAAASAILGSQAPTYLFLFGNTLGLSSSISIIIYLTARFPFQREMAISMIAMMFTYGCAIASFTPVKGAKFLLVGIALFLPFLSRWLPRLVKHVWKRMRRPSAVKIGSTFLGNSFPCFQK